ncbi:MAG TPA: cytochrome c biogenesis protein CcdA [Bauldia sp.]|nr:cytochrome c biogenesis protein CcdA [Bauldia sp.]
MDVTYGGALLAGLLSFVSPCVLPLVPPYLCYLAGVSLDQLTGEAVEAVARRKIVLSALTFVLGFSTVFILLGAGASALGTLVRTHLDILGIAAGILIIVMGLHFLGVFRIGLLYREARMSTHGHPAGPLGSYFVGLAFAIGWTPCIGPVLATILVVAGGEQTVAEGAGLLAVYSFGLGLPFLAAGLFAGAFMGFMQRFRRHFVQVERAMGALLIVTGILFITGQITAISFWLLDLFPGLARLG